MLIHPWDGAISETEWRDWLAAGHDFGQLAVNDPDNGAPHVIPTHFAVDGGTLSSTWPGPTRSGRRYRRAANRGDERRRRLRLRPDDVARQSRRARRGRGANELLLRSPADLPCRDRGRPPAQGRSLAPPASALPATRRPCPGRCGHAPIWPDAFRNPRPAAPHRERCRQVQVRRPQPARAPSQGRRTPGKPRIRPGPLRSRAATQAPQGNRRMEPRH